MSIENRSSKESIMLILSENSIVQGDYISVNETQTQTQLKRIIISKSAKSSDLILLIIDRGK
jgi:hypothetical protein